MVLIRECDDTGKTIEPTTWEEKTKLWKEKKMYCVLQTYVCKY